MSSFEESFICYKAGAFKAGLLFGYLGLVTVLRNRILSASVPLGFTQTHWEKIQKDIRFEEIWDSEVFKATQQKTPSEIFSISENLRKQIEFWKNRRNDCAHSKDNQITSAYVEALYSFIRSNINKLVVNGNRNSLLQRIINYFDPSLTPPNQSLEPIIRDLPHAVASNDLESFLAEIFKFFDDSRNQTEKMLGSTSENKLKFINASFQFGTNQLKESCKNLLIADDSLIYSFIRGYSDKCGFLSGHPDRVRRVWHEFLFVKSHGNNFALMAALLRSGLVPDGEIEEMFECVLRKGITELPNAVDDLILIEKGFYKSLEKIALEKMPYFDWANNSRDLVIKYLTDYPITVEMARRIFSVFSSTNHPWHLAESLNDFFRINAAKKHEYIDITKVHNEIGIPDKIKSLN